MITDEEIIAIKNYMSFKKIVKYDDCLYIPATDLTFLRTMFGLDVGGKHLFKHFKVSYICSRNVSNDKGLTIFHEDGTVLYRLFTTEIHNSNDLLIDYRYYPVCKTQKSKTRPFN